MHIYFVTRKSKHECNYHIDLENPFLECFLCESFNYYRKTTRTEIYIHMIDFNILKNVSWDMNDDIAYNIFIIFCIY